MVLLMISATQINKAGLEEKPFSKQELKSSSPDLKCMHRNRNPFFGCFCSSLTHLVCLRSPEVPDLKLLLEPRLDSTRLLFLLSDGHGLDGVLREQHGGLEMVW